MGLSQFQAPDPAAYNALVWLIARQIPPGKVSTYGQIASMIPPPQGAAPDAYARLSPRWVGAAMRAAPDDVPWQRVINSQGKISPRGSGDAVDEQRARLEAEGVAFSAQGRVDFEVYAWDGPDPTWVRDHGLLPPRSLRQKPPAKPAQPGLF